MRQIAEAIAGGRLKPGDKLDSHRDLAEQLVIAPLTVKKAYDELEALGYIETQRGRGTFVCAKLPRVSLDEQRERTARGGQNAALASVSKWTRLQLSIENSQRRRPRNYTRAGRLAKQGGFMSPILEFDNIVRAYKKGVPVLNGVSFSHGRGRGGGLAGPQRRGQDHADPYRDGTALSAGRAACACSDSRPPTIPWR